MFVSLILLWQKATFAYWHCKFPHFPFSKWFQAQRLLAFHCMALKRFVYAQCMYYFKKALCFPPSPETRGKANINAFDFSLWSRMSHFISLNQHHPLTSLSFIHSSNYPEFFFAWFGDIRVWIRSRNCTRDECGEEKLNYNINHNTQIEKSGRTSEKLRRWW